MKGHTNPAEMNFATPETVEVMQYWREVLPKAMASTQITSSLPTPFNRKSMLRSLLESLDGILSDCTKTCNHKRQHWSHAHRAIHPKSLTENNSSKMKFWNPCSIIGNKKKHGLTSPKRDDHKTKRTVIPHKSSLPFFHGASRSTSQPCQCKARQFSHQTKISQKRRARNTKANSVASQNKREESHSELPVAVGTQPGTTSHLMSGCDRLHP